MSQDCRFAGGRLPIGIQYQRWLPDPSTASSSARRSTGARRGPFWSVGVALAGGYRDGQVKCFVIGQAQELPVEAQEYDGG
jgi:hypothetical protein